MTAAAAQTSSSLEARFAEAMLRLLPDQLPRSIAVSVSGGGDSTALMYLAAAWAKETGVDLHVASIDHGLRPDSASEAAQVASQAKSLGLSHTTLRWSGWDGVGNLQQQARDARRGLLEHWRGGISHILLGHTMDDQAETLCLNLARGSGVAGLSAMAESTTMTVDAAIDPAAIEGPLPEGSSQEPAAILRPLLGERRATLRDWLETREVSWSHDPSNDDPSYDRVRIRQAFESNNALGLNVEGLAATATRMRRVREALARRTAAVLRRISRTDHGDVLFEQDALMRIEDETRMALMAHALQWVSSATYRPREDALIDVLGSAFAGRASTLHGCLITSRRGGIRVTREEKAVDGMRVPVAAVTRWDQRWVIRGPVDTVTEIRALGQRGIAQLSRMPGDDLPRPSLASYPAVWAGGVVMGLPGLIAGPWEIALQPPSGGFGESL